MKNKIALLLAVIFSLGVLSLTACTDKKQTRELDDVEQYIIGTWISHSTGITETYNSDGTWTMSNGNRGTFKHNGNGVDDELGHYERITLSTGSNLALFNDYPDRLYYIDRENTVQGYSERQ